jgi:lysozyme
VDLRSQIIRDEGVVEYAYEDSLGYWTIGVGHLIDRRRGGKLPMHIIEALLDWDLKQKTIEVYERWPWVMNLEEPRKATIINMAFQLGVAGLAGFVRAMGFMERGEYTAAALTFAESKVAREQTPKRWARHCEQIKTGEWV